MKRTTRVRLTVTVLLLASSVGCGGGDTPPTLRLFGPYDRDVWLVGHGTIIGWQASETGPNIRVELYRNGLGGASEVIGVFTAADDSQPWVPTAPTSENCVLVATDASDASLSAVSDAFRIVGPGVYAIGPHVSDPLTLGDTVLAEWHGPAAIQASITDVRIELSRDGGATWVDIAASRPVGDWNYSWTITDGGLPLPQTDCRFRVSEVGNPAANDVSLSFSIE